MRALLLSLLLLGVLHASARSGERVLFIDDERNVDGAEYFAWPGSEHALPINDTQMHYTEIVQRALAMQPVQDAIAQFLSRGYLRRADLDAGFSLPGAAAVTIAFEKPGHPIDRVEPMILVTSKKLDGYVATQICGGIVRSPDGQLETMVLDQTEEDPSIQITGEVIQDSGESGGVEPEQTIGVNFQFSAFYDPVETFGKDGRLWRFLACMVTGQTPSTWSGWAGHVASGAEVGFWSGVRRGLPTNGQGARELTYGMAIGAYAANRAFWMTHDDSGC